MTGAQWVVKAMQKQGIKTVFGYPGGAIMPLYDALYDGGIDHVLCRHEQGAVLAAVGYARASGQVGVCIATSGPGATNLITGLADAMSDSVPLVAITGQVASPFIGTDAFQEIDVLGLSLACTKHSFLVESVECLPEIMAEAFYIATHGRPGPVLIDIPKDIQLANAESIPFFNLPSSVLPQVNLSDIEKARQLLQRSQRPILYVGGGVTLANAVSTVKTFIEQTHIPCVETLKGRGVADYKNPYYLGMLGMHGCKEGNYAVQECDLLLAVGVRFDDRVTGNLNEFAPDAKVIHIDIDPVEFHKLRQASVTLCGDINVILPQLTIPLSIQDWQKRVLGLKQEHVKRYDHPGEVIYAPLLLKQLSECKPKNTVVTTDVGQHQMWTAQHMNFAYPNDFLTSSGLGTMGFGIPAAIGAQMVRPDGCVICISGDGSFMMNVQELNTIKRRQLPVKIILFDNQRLGMVRQWQQLFFDSRYSETNLSDNADFLQLASAFDIKAQSISKKAEVMDALNTLLDHEGPYLLHVVIDELENVWPLVPPGANNATMLDAHHKGDHE